MQVELLVEQVSQNDLGTKLGSLLSNKPGQPLHILVGVYHWCEMIVRIDKSVSIVYVSLLEDSSVAMETSDTPGHYPQHLRHLLHIFFDGAGKEEVGILHAYPGKLRQFFCSRYCILDMIGHHAPSSRVLRRNRIIVLATDGGREFP